nr:hypothetical protein Iba_scaffold14897CG0250 [Ipomoea batatas]
MGRLILEDQIFDKPRVPVHLKIMVEHLRRHYGLPNFLRHRASPKNVINILTNSPTVVAVINKGKMSSFTFSITHNTPMHDQP